MDSASSSFFSTYDGHNSQADDSAYEHFSSQAPNRPRYASPGGQKKMFPLIIGALVLVGFGVVYAFSQQTGIGNVQNQASNPCDDVNRLPLTPDPPNPRKAACNATMGCLYDPATKLCLAHATATVYPTPTMPITPPVPSRTPTPTPYPSPSVTPTPTPSCTLIKDQYYCTLAASAGCFWLSCGNPTKSFCTDGYRSVKEACTQPSPKPSASPRPTSTPYPTPTPVPTRTPTPTPRVSSTPYPASYFPF
jgi:hypothetical protein